MAGEPVPGHCEPSKLEAVREARQAPLDEARPAAIARHKAKGRLTARENIADLLDDPARRGAMGAASRERAVAEFSYDVLAARLGAALGVAA